MLFRSLFSIYIIYMSAALKETDKDAVRRNPNDVLGIQFNQYKNTVYSASITIILINECLPRVYNFFMLSD